MMAFSAARLTVAWVTPFSLLSRFSMARAQFMQVIPPMLRTIFLVFSCAMLFALAVAFFVCYFMGVRGFKYFF